MVSQLPGKIFRHTVIFATQGCLLEVRIIPKEEKEAWLSAFSYSLSESLSYTDPKAAFRLFGLFERRFSSGEGI